MSFPFSFTMPTDADGPSLRLPPSFSTTHGTFLGETIYQLRVTLMRKGFRVNERLENCHLSLQ
jgi:hypothetical protein